MRQSQDIELAMADHPVGVSRQRWLGDQIREAILAGRLTSGARLPPTRDLAQRHGLSRGTVLAVFEQLASEGYLVGEVGRGTFVAPELPDPAFRADPTGTMGEAFDPRISNRGRVLSRTPFSLEPRTGPSQAFRPNQPDLGGFPFELWARLSARKAREVQPAMLTDGDPLGYHPLREAMAQHLRASRGIACSPEQVAILGSVQQVIDLCARLLLDEGESVWMEDPGYLGARMVFEAAGLRIVGVPVDSGGLDVAIGRLKAPRARLAYLTAGRQSPLGMPMSLERRLALLNWAAEAGATLIEDDYDSEFRFQGPPRAAMKSLDRDGHVVYTGTFSKLLFPALRLAYAILPVHLVPSFAAACSLSFRYVPLGPQATLSAFIAEGHFGRHLRRMRVLYAERAQALESAVAGCLSGLLELPAITAGLDAPAFLPPDLDDRRVARAALQNGVECRPLSFYEVEQRPPSGLLLGFAPFEAKEIRAGAERLRKAMESLRAKDPD